MLEGQGRSLYESRQFGDALAVLQRAVYLYHAQGDRLRQAATLSNLSLVHQSLGNWMEATQSITASLELLRAIDSNSISDLSVLGQALNVQGELQFSQGQIEQALMTWKQAATTFEQVGDHHRAASSQLNQAQALQELGLYRQAIDLIAMLTQPLNDQPDLLTQAIAWRSLGDAQLAVGDLNQAQQSLHQSLAILETLSNQHNAIAVTRLSLGNLARAQAIATLSLRNMTVAEALIQLNRSSQSQLSPAELIRKRQQLETAQQFYQKMEEASDFYQQAVAIATADSTRIQAQINQFRVMVETERWAMVHPLSTQLQRQLQQLSPNRANIDSQIDFASVWITAVRNHSLSPTAVHLLFNPQSIAQVLSWAIQQADALGDSRTQSYALGTLAALYEQTHQWSEAETLTQRALMLSQSINAADVSYRWQWQLGRLLKTEGDRQGAIAAYSEAAVTLQSLRGDLVAVNRDIQFSFRETIEPLYREFADLLLQGDETTEADLLQARRVIEGLQIAELDNFFREACLDASFDLDHVVEQANQKTAVLYTIVLPSRLEVILKLPQQALQHYSTPITQSDVDRTVTSLLDELKHPYRSQQFQSLSQQLYQWLIHPAESSLAEGGVESLVFVLDSSLQRIPMATLYDGHHYLIETYQIALAPGLQLFDPQPLQKQPLRALVAGLSEAKNQFPPLNYVETEVRQIQAYVPSEILLNQAFTRENFQASVNATPFPIVHIATHGQFSSNLEDTFILTWDQAINVNELRTLLQDRALDTSAPIELLVLSACQTATGDRRAALGLAGVAIRAGARSTIASLWNLDDDSGAWLMSQFYQELLNKSISKAEALRRAQVSLLKNPQYDAPRFWAPYVLLGNWL